MEKEKLEHLVFDCEAAWVDFYLSKNETMPTINGKSRKNLQTVIVNLRRKMIFHGIEETYENILDFFITFLQTIDDKWILKNLDISIINSKFDILFANAYKKTPDFRQKINSSSKEGDASVNKLFETTGNN